MLNKGSFLMFVGAAFDQKYYSGEMTMRQAWNQTWDTNVTGTQVMTHVFAPLLLKSSDPRLLFLTSGTANLTEHDNVAWPFNQSPPEGWPKQQSGVPMYRSSKVGLNMMMRYPPQLPRAQTTFQS